MFLSTHGASRTFWSYICFVEQIPNNDKACASDQSTKTTLHECTGSFPLNVIQVLECKSTLEDNILLFVTTFEII
jgi:hypothetical protein